MTTAAPDPVRPDPAGDWVILDTGRQVRLAKPAARLIAKIVDGVILVGISLLITWGLQGFGKTVLSPPPTGYWSTVIATWLISALYEIGLVAWRGQTLGKMAVRIRIVGLDGGGLPGLGKSIRRWSLPAILAVPLYLTGEVEFSSGAAVAIFAGAMVAVSLILLCHAWLIWDRIRRGWHDMIAGTIVLKVEGGTMDRYDREEQSYDRREPDLAESGAGEAPGDFPWEESGGGDQAPQAWEEQPADEMSARALAEQQAAERNPLAITGFILSLVMWIALPVPILSLLLWIMALTFSSIGLSRARKLGARYKGLAIAGLCLSLVGVVIVIFFILFLVGSAVVSSV